MKRKKSDLRAVIPAMTEWTVEPGDKVRAFSPKGDPRDPLTDLSQAYLVPDPFMLQPSYISDFIRIDLFSENEIQKLEADLNAPISKKMLAEIHRAISQFVCTISLGQRMATWRQIEDRLQLILKTCETLAQNAHLLMNLINPNVVDESVSRGVLSADQLVKKMLMDRDGKNSTVLQIDLTSVVNACKSASGLVALKTKRGRKPESVFRLFLSRLVSTMKADGHQIKIPSNEIVFDNVHPTFVFLDTALRICIEKGKTAIVASELDDTEKSEAVRALSQFRKSQRALVHYLRDGSLI